MVNRVYSKGPNHKNWKGGTTLNNGRLMVSCPGHPRANKGSYVFEHILTAEKALGKYLSPKAIVHHHNSGQLVICQDQAYHMLLHQRTRALQECGHINWRKCRFCKKYDDPKNLYISPAGKHIYHQECHKANILQIKIKPEILEWFLKGAEESGRYYQDLINEALEKHIFIIKAAWRAWHERF